MFEPLTADILAQLSAAGIEAKADTEDYNINLFDLDRSYVVYQSRSTYLYTTSQKQETLIALLFVNGSYLEEIDYGYDTESSRCD